MYRHSSVSLNFDGAPGYRQKRSGNMHVERKPLQIMESATA
jgi:hypothetical protein